MKRKRLKKIKLKPEWLYYNSLAGTQLNLVLTPSILKLNKALFRSK